MKGEKIVMKVQTGYLYHIKDDFFDIVNDDNLMQNHEKGKKRPTYFTIKDNDILWFIPISSKIDKYKKIIDKKIEKYGFCNTILIEKIFDEESAILLQNAFPTLEKYIEQGRIVFKKDYPLNERGFIFKRYKSSSKKLWGKNTFY